MVIAMRLVSAIIASLIAASPAIAQTAHDPVAAIVGEWDKLDEGINLLIQPDRIVRHSKLGSGDIQHDNVNIFIIRYRQHHITCRYEVKAYSQDRIVFHTIMRPSPQECELGVLERAPKSNQDDTKRSEKPSKARHKELSAFKDCDACPEMIVVPRGHFDLGSPEGEYGRMKYEGPIQKVTIKYPFAASRYAITRDQFMAFVQDTNYAYGRTCFADTDRGPVDLPNHSVLAPPGFAQDGRHPAVCLNWRDGMEYARWLSTRTGQKYRLLSETEREYIARAGTTTAYWWGPTVDPNRANYDKRIRSNQPPKPAKGKKLPTPVTSTPTVAHGSTFPVDWGPPNPWGFFQVNGNVSEWTLDCWKDDYRGISDNGSARTTGDCTYRVARGGAWSSWPEDIRAAYRGKANSDYRFASIGFRVARELEATIPK